MALLDIQAMDSARDTTAAHRDVDQSLLSTFCDGDIDLCL